MIKSIFEKIDFLSVHRNIIIDYCRYKLIALCHYLHSVNKKKIIYIKYLKYYRIIYNIL